MSTWSRQKTNNCRQTNAQKTEDRAARTPLKPGMNTGGPGKQFLVHYWHMYYLVWISLILIRKLLCCLSLSTTGAIVAVIIWSLDQQLPAQSVTITTKIVSSNPIHGEVYSIQHYVIKVCPWLATGQQFPPSTPVSSTNKIDRHDTTEILLKATLNTKNQTKPINCIFIRIVFLPIGNLRWHPEKLIMNYK
jgi:hypothetical protein